jgi:hypothetical protein
MVRKVLVCSTFNNLSDNSTDSLSNVATLTKLYFVPFSQV